MIFLTWLVINLILLCNIQTINAGVLLIPHANQSFESYRDQCSQENSFCTYKLIYEFLEKIETAKYNQLISDLDLQSPAFVSTISYRVTDIIESEMISLDQLESLISILQRAEEITDNKKVKLLRIEMTQYFELIRKAPSVENFNYVFLKKPLGKISFEKLKSLSFNPYFKQINYKEEVVADQPVEFKTGQCSKSQLSEIANTYFSNVSIVFAAENSCSWMDSMSEVFSTSRTDSKFKLTSTERNIFLWSAVAIGVGLFLHQYEVKIEY